MIEAVNLSEEQAALVAPIVARREQMMMELDKLPNGPMKQRAVEKVEEATFWAIKAATEVQP